MVTRAPQADPATTDEDAHPLQAGAAPAAARSGSLLFVLRRTVREFLDDGGTDLAAALTYYSVLALFPALIALLSLVGVFGQAQQSVDMILEVLRAAGLRRPARHDQRPAAATSPAMPRRRRRPWSSACSARSGRPRATSAPSAAR